jgi:hypothetical protein
MPRVRLLQTAGNVPVLESGVRGFGAAMPRVYTIGAYWMSRLRKDAIKAARHEFHARRTSFPGWSFKKLIDRGLERELA